VERWQVVNALPGWRALATKLATAGVARVGIEATGGYERGIVRYLRVAGFTVLVLQPIQVRAYARVCLRRAKNDALDAALIAACAANLDPARIEPDPRLADLVGHLSFVEQIEADIARFKTRLEHVDDRRLRRLIINDIARLKARRNAELRRIGERLRAHDDLALRLDLVLSVPGIGERTAIALICRSSGTSAASKPPRWPALLPSTTIAESIRANAASPAAARDCAAPCSPPHCLPPSAGTRR
jgi:transposase